MWPRNLSRRRLAASGWSRRSAASNRFSRRLEQLEHRILLSAIAVDSGSGSLTIDAGAAEVSAAPNGALLVALDGGPASAVTGLRAEDLQKISLVGSGAGDTLTLDALTTSRSLTVSSDGSITVNAAIVAAGGLAITSGGQLNVESGGSLTGSSSAISADEIINVGRIEASSSVAISARNYLNAGTVSSPGGSVQIDFTESYIDTTAATTSVADAGGAGGRVLIDGGTTGRLFSSGRFDATGASGGSIQMSGGDVLLVGATADASGSTSGGNVEVGGGLHGAAINMPDAPNVDVSATTTLRADGNSGHGGTVVVWSTVRTDFAGGASAQGQGTVEVSSAGGLNFTGKADAGQGGTVLLDPKNLVVSNAPTGVFPQFNLVNPGKGGSFGDEVVPLSTGNIVVTDSTVNNAGAVYLFNGTTGALISTLIESGGNLGGVETTLLDVKALPSGNFVVVNSFWNSFSGAATWVNGTTGLSGAVSASNSLVGSHSGNINTGDEVGGGTDPFQGVGSEGVVVLPNGNYTVYSAIWNSKRGAVTWGSGTSGVRGTVSASNSLVGANSGDEVGGVPDVDGFGIVLLKNGNYVVPSPQWNSKTGAVTWGSRTTGVKGTVSSSNSLIGEGPGDEVGLTFNNFGNLPGITPLANGNYVVSSVDWNSGAGAATLANGSHATTGMVTSDNSLTGDIITNQAGDHVGQSVIALANGNYVVGSPEWNFNEGAATWGSGTKGVTGLVSSTNSLVGTREGFVAGNGDEVGSAITPLSNGNYVVQSPNWSDPKGSTFVGAMTWSSGTKGITGTISSINSLIGSTSDDLRNAAAFALTRNGNYVVVSPNWNGGAGAVTWGNGTSGVHGAIVGTNSLIGSQAGDHVGGDFASSGGTFSLAVTLLANGNYVVDSPNWKSNTGAVTWGNGATGISGSISAGNSLIGSQTGDQVGAKFDASSGAGSGGVTQLTNGNYVVASVFWNHDTGAVTWGSGSAGVVGTISATNSLIGAATGDAVGGLTSTFANGVTPLPNGNYVVASPNFSSGKGAITLGNGKAGSHGTVSSSNSLVGSVAGDMLGGAFSNVIALSNSNYVVNSPKFDGGLGAITWAGGTGGATLDGKHTVDKQNSIEGTVSGADNFSIPAQGTLPGSFVAVFPQENGGTVTIAFTDPNQITSTLAENQTVSVTPAFIAGSLNAGTHVTLQATNNITLSSPVSANAGAKGRLTLQAGGDIIINTSVSAATLAGLSATSTSLSVTSSFSVSLNGTTAGGGASGTYTQTQVTGPINLGSATLHVNNSGGFAVEQVFIIITSTAPITTKFAGLAEGTAFAAGGQDLKISYLNDKVTLTVLPLDAPLKATALTITPTKGVAFSGNVATFTDADPNGTPTDYTATINWGNGVTSTGTITAVAGGGFAVTGSHTYAAVGTDTVVVTITDIGGSQASADSTAKISASPSSAAQIVAAKDSVFLELGG